MEKLKNVFFTDGYFSPGEEGEIDTDRFFKEINELGKFIEKYLIKMTTILLYNIQAIFIGNLEFLNEKTDLNMEEVLTNLIFWNMRV